MVKITTELEILESGVGTILSVPYEVMNGKDLVLASLKVSMPKINTNYFQPFIRDYFQGKDDIVTVTGSFTAKKDLVPFYEASISGMTSSKRILYGALLGASREIIIEFWEKLAVNL